MKKIIIIITAGIIVAFLVALLAAGSDLKKENNKEAKCGNASIEKGEECDQDDLGGAVCADVLGDIYVGSLDCFDNCRYDVSDCRRFNEDQRTCPAGEEGEGVQCTEDEYVEVISYSDTYIPPTMLKLRTPAECDCCGEDHWHAAYGPVITSEGEEIDDPFSDCGIGTVEDMPVIKIKKRIYSN